MRRIADFTATSGTFGTESTMRVSPFALIAFVGIATPALRSQDVVPVPVRPESRIWFDGNATMHAFTCTAGEFAASVARSGAPDDDTFTGTRVVRHATLTIPVGRLGCGDGKMEKSMRKALKADANPDIRFELAGYEIRRETNDSAVVTADGTLELAGAERPVALTVSAKRRADGAVRLTGSQELLMTDFGIRPPSAMFGMIKASNRIVVRFDLVVSAEQVTAARQ
ncbi:MAG TPA: YceI family protein [Gemmatimonadaceae bacterium]|nr:YceI family protein [Gemmatimonadaceae bacterium]